MLQDVGTTLLNTLAAMLSELGRCEEALTAALEAADLYRALARARPEAFTPDLATSLNWIHEVKHDGYRLIARKEAPTNNLASVMGYKKQGTGGREAGSFRSKNPIAADVIGPRLRGPQAELEHSSPRAGARPYPGRAPARLALE